MWGGVSFDVYPDSTAASAVLYFNGLPDYDEMRFMADYLRYGDGFLDVGANIGTYTLYAASLTGGRVDAFEPGEKARQRLAAQVERNGFRDVEVWPYALSDQEGTVRFSVDSDTTNHVVGKTEAPVNVVEVQTRELDKCCGSRSYAMGKIDIEGAEPLALAGAENMLAARNPPVWLLEVNGCLHRYGHTEEGLRDWLAERGYRMAVYDADKGRLRYPQRPWEERPNVLAVAEDCVDHVTTRIATTHGDE
ncbi:FkbM family methyltransferase [Arhodomonas sp. SL1]|uniref:FkbM family methyltransferase n=1 Tax=Arhodomonas sp. SL1 TaxID=3425691 RepID=UPI003F880F73